MKASEFLTKEDLISCIELGKSIVSELESEKLFRIILDKLSELIPARNWSLLLVDQETGELCFNLCAGLNPGDLNHIRLKEGEGIAGRVLKEKSPLIIRDVATCDYFTNRIDEISGFKTTSIICVPLLCHGSSVGVLEAINPSSLTERDLAILEIIADYTAIAVVNMRLYHYREFLVDHDNLTGFYNTRYMYHDLTERIEKCRAVKSNFSLIFMDIDNFKKVVERYGHLNASRAIKEVALLIQGVLTGFEYCVSYAGDEFVIVIPDTGRERAIERADEIRRKISEGVYQVKTGVDIKLSASFGIAVYPHDGDTLSGLLSKADIAMFQVKESGRNGVQS